MKTIPIFERVAAAVNAARGVYAASTSARLRADELIATPPSVRELKRTEVRAPLLALAMVVVFATFTASAQVNLSIGTLAPGEKVIVTFDVTINTNFPANTFAITNQATLTATGVTLNSDDPATALLNDPTVTQLTAAPQITSCPPNATTNTLTGACSRNVAFAATGYGGQTPPTFTYTLLGVPITSPYSFEPGTNVVTVTASNGILPNATCSFSVVVKDQEAPTMLCPADIVTNAVGGCGAVVTFPTASFASDPCGPTNLTATPASGSSFPAGTNLVTVVAQDRSGNSNGCTFKVIVQSVAAAPPLLTILPSGTNVVLCWSNVYSCYQLQSTPQLLLPPATNVWTAHPGPFIPSGGNIYVTNAIDANSRFFRLAY